MEHPHTLQAYEIAAETIKNAILQGQVLWKRSVHDCANCCQDWEDIPQKVSN